MRSEEGNKALNKYNKHESDDSSFNGYSGVESETNLAECCGCTSWVCLIVGDQVYCANAGDSRAVLSKGKKAIPLSFDHKPSNPEEEKRIIAAGGFVESDRVNGNLNLSRALGDFMYKENKDVSAHEQMVLWIPEIRSEIIDKDTEFIIIACDGIWDCLENQEAVDFIHEQHKQLVEAHGDAFKVSDINCAIFDNNLAKDTFGSANHKGKEGVGCDNMTSVIVMFKHSD